MYTQFPNFFLDYQSIIMLDQYNFEAINRCRSNLKEYFVQFYIPFKIISVIWDKSVGEVKMEA